MFLYVDGECKHCDVWTVAKNITLHVSLHDIMTFVTESGLELRVCAALWLMVCDMYSHSKWMSCYVFLAWICKLEAIRKGWLLKLSLRMRLRFRNLSSSGKYSFVSSRGRFIFRHEDQSHLTLLRSVSEEEFERHDCVWNSVSMHMASKLQPKLVEVRGKHVCLLLGINPQLVANDLRVKSMWRYACAPVCLIKTAVRVIAGWNHLSSQKRIGSGQIPMSTLWLTEAVCNALI